MKPTARDINSGGIVPSFSVVPSLDGADCPGLGTLGEYRTRLICGFVSLAPFPLFTEPCTDEALPGGR